MRRKNLFAAILLLFLFSFAGCKGEDKTADKTGSYEEIPTVGFAQVGAESDWRIANTESMINAFEDDGNYIFLLENALQKQTNQFTAVRSFIQQDVDYIVIAPVTESGWDNVLTEVQKADIPVIIVDRMVDVEDSTLYTCWVGSDFLLEGKKVTEWLHSYTEARGIKAEELHIVDVQGTKGATSQIGRTNGLLEAAAKYGWEITATVDGDYTAAKAYEEMTDLLSEYDNINVVYCENDNEAFGVIDAIEDSGKTPGYDIEKGEIMVLSFDGVSKEALEYVYEGKIACIGECNPHHGPRVKEIIELLRQGLNPDRYYYVEEQIFSSDDTVKSVIITGNEYPVTLITKESLADALEENDAKVDG